MGHFDEIFLTIVHEVWVGYVYINMYKYVYIYI